MLGRKLLLYSVLALIIFLSNDKNSFGGCPGREMENGFCWPTESEELLLAWHGYNPDFAGSHLAQDIGAVEGNAVYAIADGLVLYSRMDVACYAGFNNDDSCIDGGGLIIKHRSSNGQYFTALYGHVKNISAGSTVTKGQKIAEIGPYSNGTVHLHFGVRSPFNDDADRWAGYGVTDKGFVDPISFIQDNAPFVDFSNDSNVSQVNVRTVGQISWYPPNKTCVNASEWVRIVDGRAIQSFGSNSACYSVGLEYLNNSAYYDVLFGTGDLPQECSQ